MTESEFLKGSDARLETENLQRRQTSSSPSAEEMPCTGGSPPMGPSWGRSRASSPQPCSEDLRADGLRQALRREGKQPLHSQGDWHLRPGQGAGGSPGGLRQRPGEGGLVRPDVQGLRRGCSPLACPPEQLLQYWGGDERGMQIPEDLNMLPLAVPVATQLPHAVGLAMARRLRGRGR